MTEQHSVIEQLHVMSGYSLPFDGVLFAELSNQAKIRNAVRSSLIFRSSKKYLTKENALNQARPISTTKTIDFSIRKQFSLCYTVRDNSLDLNESSEKFRISRPSTILEERHLCEIKCLLGRIPVFDSGKCRRPAVS